MNDCEKCDAFRELAAVAETECDQHADRADRAEREAQRQKDHNKLQEAGIRGEREQRKAAQAEINRLKVAMCEAGHTSICSCLFAYADKRNRFDALHATIRTLVVALKKARKWMVAEAVSMQEADEFEADWVTVEAALKSAGSAEDTKFCDFEDCDQEPADGSLLCDGHIQEEEKSHS